MSAKWYILSILVFLTFWLGRSKIASAPKNFHSSVELTEFRALEASNELGSIFRTSKVCQGCHGYDPTGIASRDTNGLDINVHDDWAASMMGLAAKDPYWRAKVAHETFKIPDQKAAIESKCLTCHAPMGHYQALYKNMEYGMVDLFQDSLGLDGVSCMVCHSISQDNLGKGFSGELTLDTFRLSYGPYPFPFDGPMTNFVGIRPIYSFHIFDAGICADCHTLITKSFDTQGLPTGETFVEQATYHEWLNSKYAAEGTTCQSCHMEALYQPIVVASGINALAPREYYRKHNFNGANVQMLQAIKNNLDYLNLNIADSLFDESIKSAKDNLSNRSVDISLSSFNTTDSAIVLRYQLLNKTGHKFPSGYPSRRAYLEFILTNEQGDTVFHSGSRNNNRILPDNLSYFPHFQTIDNEANTQVYQIVNVNTDLVRTEELVSAYQSVKDNRLTPIGFSRSHSTYDTVSIIGNALQDPDFNQTADGTEGTGSDFIEYHIRAEDYSLDLGMQYTATLTLWYESIPLRELDSLASSGLSQVDTLLNVLNGSYQAQLVDTHRKDSLSLIVNAIEYAENPLKIYPNPFCNSINFECGNGWTGGQIYLFDVDGNLIKELSNLIGLKGTLDTSSLSAGVYFLVVRNQDGTFHSSHPLIKY